MPHPILLGPVGHFALALLLPAAGPATATPAGPAPVFVHGLPPQTAIVVERSRPGWWRGRPGFTIYAGPRRGYYYAPGYGYYLPPRGLYGRRWTVGVTLPIPMRRYVVVDPLGYGLRVPPPGYRWYYAGNRIVLAAIATGIIMETVAGGW
jgi:hypothetical protein